MIVLPESFDARDLHFRPWVYSDVDTMCTLFDTEQMNRWTPLASPFTVAEAREYVRRAHEGREHGTMQWAICLDAEAEPIGEVLVFPSGEQMGIELAYAVCADHQRHGVAQRAITSVLDEAIKAGAVVASLTIAQDNEASQATAAAVGFSKTEQPVRVRERKGFILPMETWVRQL